MKPHPRIRKTVKWGGVVVTVLLVLVWIGSGWWTLAYFRSGRALILQRGQVRFFDLADRTLFKTENWAVSADPRAPSWDWWFSLQGADGAWAACLPIWCLLVVALLISATAWRFDALARQRARHSSSPHPVRNARPGFNALVAVAVVLGILLFAWMLRR